MYIINTLTETNSKANRILLPDTNQVIRQTANGTSGKAPPCQCRRQRDEGSIPGLERSPGEGNGNPLQYSCLENPMDRGAWWATVNGLQRV